VLLLLITLLWQVAGVVVLQWEAVVVLADTEQEPD
jgi:hypothetical protein